jgi:pimeloyl-ACP methyl ester carboxylesterase
VADLEKELDALMLQTRYAKVIFICHSLGGIVARQYLLHVKNRCGHTALGRFRLVITLGTPMQGSALARLAVLASSNEQLRVLGLQAPPCRGRQPRAASSRLHDLQYLVVPQRRQSTALGRGLALALSGAGQRPTLKDAKKAPERGTYGASTGKIAYQLVRCRTTRSSLQAIDFILNFLLRK